MGAHSTVAGRLPVRGVLVLLLGLLASLLAATPPAEAAVYADSSTAHLVPSSTARRNGPNEKLGYVKIMTPGTYVATLSARIRDDSIDPIQVASISLLCKEESRILDKMGTAANVFRGETFPMSVRVYFTIAKRGACFGYGATMILDRSSVPPARRGLRASASMVVAGPVSDATVESRRFAFDDPERDSYAGRSFLARPGRQTHAGELTTSAMPGSSAFVSGQAYLTSCVSEGGSRDASTGGRSVCTPGVVRHGDAGSLLRLRMMVRQYTPGGSACATTIVPSTSRRIRITARRHHLPVTLEGDVTLPANTRCGGRVRAWMEIAVLSGPAVVVHFPNTSSAYRPQ